VLGVVLELNLLGIPEYLAIPNTIHFVDSLRSYVYFL